jgi:molybdate transport system permease protein
VGLASTVAILPFGVALSWLFARKEWRFKSAVETAVLLPLVMPPVSTGLILLKIFGRRSPLGQWLYERGVEILFNWKGVLIAMSVMSFPLLVRSVRTSFAEVNPRLEQIAATLGASPLRIFFGITIPLAMRGIVAGSLLAFSRALGEFGATILVAGNIPGKTQTLSLAIFNFVQTGKDAEAYTLLAITVVLAFALVWCSERLLRPQKGG